MVKVNVSSMSNQSTTVSTASSNRTNALNTAINSFNDLLNASNLQGSAFTNAKAYSSNVLIPLIQGMLLYTEKLGTNTAELSTLYSQYCGNEDLDSADLERQIASYQSSLRAARNAYNLLLTDASATSKAKTSARSTVNGIQSSLQDVQEKLTNLNAFNAASATVFSGMSNLEIALNQGITQVGSDYSSFSKTKSFPEYNSTNLPWVQVINGQIETLNKNEGEELSDEEINMIVEFYTSITSLTKDYNILDNDVAKRAAQLFNLLPSKLTKALMKSDGFWELTTILSDSSQTKLITALAAYEGLTDLTKTSKFGKGLQFGFSAYERYKEVISPVKTFVSSYLKASPEYSYIRATGKLLGKAGTYLTYADLAVTGVSSGVNEYGKTGSVGKAVIGGTIDAVASIGPLEGATIGASIGGAIGTAIPVPILGTISGAAAGAVVGVAVGGVISLAKWVNPDIASDAKEFAYTVYDNTTEKIKKVGRVVASSASETVKTVSNYISGIGKAIDFGW